MARRTAALTDLNIKKARPQEKQVMLYDGGGLFLLITPSGGKWWRFKYRIDTRDF